MNELRAELAVAARTLVRQPGFVVTAVLSLALAIALNTTMFSALDALVNPRLDIRAPDRLHRFLIIGERVRIPVAVKNEVFGEGMRQIAEGVGYVSWPSEQVAEQGTIARSAAVVSVGANFFELLGVHAMEGRLFSEARRDGDANAIVVGERLAAQLFPGRASVVGQSIVLDGTARTIIGVLPRTGDFPPGLTDVWTLPPPSASDPQFNLVRLRPGFSRWDAQKMLLVPAQRLAAIGGYPPRRDWPAGVRLTPVIAEQFRPRRFHVALAAAVLAVMLVACANLANLQLARGLARARELATRAALGATRRDLVRQLVLESGWLAAAGLALGLVLTAWGMHLLRVAVPPSVADYVVEPRASWRVFIFAVGAALFCLTMVGIAPALHVTRIDPAELLKRGAGTGTSRRARRQYATLVVVEVSLSLALLSATTLLLRSARRVHEVRYGFDIKPLATAFVPLAPDSGAASRTVYARRIDLLERVRALADVDDAVAIDYRRFGGDALTVDDPDGAPVQHPRPLGSYMEVTPGFLRTYRIPLRRGRDFLEGERDERVVIVSETTARALWPKGDAVGRRIKLATSKSREPWLRVVGVTGNASLSRRGLADPVVDPTTASLGGIWVLATDDGSVAGRGTYAHIVARARAHSERLPLSMRTALLPVAGTRTSTASMERWFGLDIDRERHDFAAWLFVIFAATATALAALGVYAVVSYSVDRRRRELGVRLALGAPANGLLAMVLREANLLALLGIAAGLVLSAMGSRLLGAFIDIDADVYDAHIFALAAALMLIVVLAAALGPARRAASMDPVEALRSDG